MKNIKISYNSFAYYYDQLMNDFPYESFINFIYKYITNHKDICDIGCGTGIISNILSNDNYNVTSLDYSDDMLFIAKERNNNIDCYNFDMRINELPIDTYNNIISLVDTVSYLIKEEELLFFLNNVYKSLKKEGVFLFDTHTIYKVNEIFNNHEEYDELDNFNYSFTSKIVDKDIVKHNIDIYVNNKVFSEEHFQKGYDSKYIVNILSKIGFSVEIDKEFTDNTRTFYICKKI